MKCAFCSNEGVIEKKMVVEGDAVHDGDEWTVVPLKETFLVCEQCAVAYDDGCTIEELRGA